jgi:serine/threonine protein kinase
MALNPGTRLGPYEIIARVGAGGMGDVYRAHDARLRRDVAVKVLPESLMRDSERMRRFEQEARAIAALSHPNVVAVFDTGTHDGVLYVVSELLEGESLRDRLKTGSIASRKAVEYAVQVADGLAAAHDKGIVHRDLKPENLFLAAGRVKILDFGLAKLERKDLTSVATAAVTAGGEVDTAAGVVMGTAAYMSPEQVRGQSVDHRSDIFSFGAVLYEMLTGKHAFTGESSVETMNAILKEDPAPIDTAEMKVSPGLEGIVRHCLEKNPAERFQSARDLAFALANLPGTESTAAVGSSFPPRKRLWWAWVAAAMVLVAVAALVFSLKPRATPRDRLEFAIPLKGEASWVALSPDGRTLTFVSPDESTGENMLNVQRVGSSAVTVLPGTEGASYPFWSPDDSFVAFFAGAKLKKVPASGGVPQVLASATSGRGGSWGRSGIIVYAPEAGGPLWKVNPDGSNSAPLTDKIFAKTDASHRWPMVLPDGDHFFFWAGNFDNVPDDQVSGIYLSSLAGRDKKVIVLTRSNPGFANGFLFHMADKQALIALPVDLREGRVLGEPRVVAEGVGFHPSTYWGAFTVAENGTLVYNPTAGAATSVLTWYDREGKELGRVGDIEVQANPTLSPDGDRVVVDATDVKSNNIDVWIADLKSSRSTRFTFDPAEEVGGSWSRDGRLIAFRSSLGGASLNLKKVEGLEPAKQILEPSVLGKGDIVATSWSADDKEILCSWQPAAGGSHLVVVPVEGGKIVPFLVTKASETNGQISSDGKWVAYASNETGEWEIYVTTFPNAAGKWQVSRGGGTEPRWRGDGKEIFYIGAKRMLTAVPVSTPETFSSGIPVPLFQIHGRASISSTDLFTYDVAKDGKRFLVNRYAKPERIAPLTIVLNATTEPSK